MHDIDVGLFARMLTRLPEHTPIAAEYEQTAGQQEGIWYSSQREHMVGWFRAQATRGSGNYTRKTPNRSSRSAYNRLLCVEAVLWMNEAAGVDSALVKQAAEAATKETNYRSRCAAARRYLPWESLYFRLTEKSSN